MFDVGLLGMALSTIALHMIASGFAVAEMTGAGPKSLAYRLGTFLPVPGVLGPLFWNDLLWLAVPTNIVCGLFLPITYVGVILWARRAERPSSAIRCWRSWRSRRSSSRPSSPPRSWPSSP